MKFGHRFLLAFAVALALFAPASQALAACASPVGAEGEIIYNDAYNVAQFCNGTDWVSMSGGASAGAESDPQVGLTTLNKWCRGDGSGVVCDQNAPLTTESDPKIGTLTASKYCTTNGTLVECTADLPIGTLTNGKWCTTNGTTVSCTSDAPTATAGADTQVIFNDGGVLAGDTSLVWDKTNNRLGIGNTPSTELEVTGTVKSSGPFWSAFGAAGTHRGLLLENFDNTAVAHGVDVAAKLGGTEFQGLSWVKETAWLSGAVATDKDAMLQLGVLLDNVASIPVVIRANGRVGIGTTSPSAQLDVVKAQNADTQSRTINLDAGSSAGATIMAQSSAGQFFMTQGSAANNSGYSVMESNTSGPLQIRKTNNSGDIVFTTTTGYTSRMVIQNGGNVGIGTASPNTSALLDVSSTTKGFLPPRVTTTERNAIATPTDGLTVYNTTTDGLETYSNGFWQTGAALRNVGRGTSGDYDTIIQNTPGGIWWMDGPGSTNGPTGTNTGTLVHLDPLWNQGASANKYSIQLATNGNNNGKLYFREQYNGTWGGWVDLTAGGSGSTFTDGGTDSYTTDDVAIGQSSAPVASAALEVESTTKGFLPPRMTTTQRDAISGPAEGLIVYNTTMQQIQYYNGSSWTAIGAVDTPSSSTPEIFSWGDNGAVGALGNGVASGSTNYLIPISSPPASPVAVYAGGYDHGTDGLHCIKNSSNQIYCWGRGQMLGDGVGTDVYIPTLTATSQTWKNMGIGSNLSLCAINASDYVYCWGRQDTNGLGNGVNSTAALLVPTGPVGGTITWSQVSSGGWYDGSNHRQFACGVRLGSGTIQCWGNNNEYQLGNGTRTNNYTTTPTSVSGANTFKAVASGGAFACGINSSDKVMCWGRGNEGQQGNGGVADGTVPAATTGNRSFSQISAGEHYICGIELTTQLGYCWGDNDNGQLGIGSTTDANVPTAIVGAKKWKKILASKNHTCGIDTTDRVFCWGDGTAGRLGNGDTANRTVPTLIYGEYRFQDLAIGPGAALALTK